MKLFKFELKKNILRISVLLLLVALIIVNFYKQYETARFLGESGIAKGVQYKSDSGRPMYEAFKGEITTEKLEKIKSYHDKMGELIHSGDFKPTNESDDRFYSGFAMGDFNESAKTIERITYAYTYPNLMIELKERAKENITFYEGRSDYEVRKNSLVAGLYTGRRIKVYGNYGAFKLFFDYEFSSLVIIVMIIYTFATSFTNEKTTGTDRIIRSCHRGKSVYLTKHAVMLLFVFASVVLFTLLDVVRFCSFYDGTFINQPLYAIEEYKYTPFNVTISGAILLSAFAKLIALIFVGELVFVISAVTKNAGLAIALSFASIGIVIFIGEYLPSTFSPLSLLNAESWLKDPQFINILGYPVISILVQLISAVALTTALAIICYFKTAYAKKEKRI
ncbi:MAG: ABC transporter permease [Ruminiclostridium sp.]|nr:ABC transporter permease [Ruminiclostridium sp.]